MGDTGNLIKKRNCQRNSKRWRLSFINFYYIARQKILGMVKAKSNRRDLQYKLETNCPSSKNVQTLKLNLVNCISGTNSKDLKRNHEKFKL